MLQAISSLIVNAYDAVVEKKDPWITINVTAQSEDFFEIAVTDSGKGLSEQMREKIFLPYFSNKGAGAGKGLSLTSSYAFVKKHGGSLTINAECPNTQFIIKYPYAQK